RHREAQGGEPVVGDAEDARERALVLRRDRRVHQAADQLHGAFLAALADGEKEDRAGAGEGEGRDARARADAHAVGPQAGELVGVGDVLAALPRLVALAEALAVVGSDKAEHVQRPEHLRQGPPGLLGEPLVGGDDAAPDDQAGALGHAVDDGLEHLEAHRLGRGRDSQWSGFAHRSRSLRSTRLSPIRRVTRSRSKYSASGMLNFLLCPVSALNPWASISPALPSWATSRALSPASAVAPNHSSSETRLARPAAASALRSCAVRAGLSPRSSGSSSTRGGERPASSRSAARRDCESASGPESGAATPVGRTRSASARSSPAPCRSVTARVNNRCGASPERWRSSSRDREGSSGPAAWCCASWPRM